MILLPLDLQQRTSTGGPTRRTTISITRWKMEFCPGIIKVSKRIPLTLNNAKKMVSRNYKGGKAYNFWYSYLPKLADNLFGNNTFFPPSSCKKKGSFPKSCLKKLNPVVTFKPQFHAQSTQHSRTPSSPDSWYSYASFCSSCLFWKDQEGSPRNPNQFSQWVEDPWLQTHHSKVKKATVEEHLKKK